PWAEDGWRRVRIGGISFRVAKPCGRCVVTTTDQATGARGREPLRTLGRHRNVDTKLLFGQNLIPENRGTLSVGDPLSVVE
ncbi:MAG: MOSC domain-containing protein, partial [Actinomycetia bacterium]|nr:MOSC domain-containing protein [Actinomycetes bacterium]